MGKFNEDGTYTNDNGETFSAKDADYAIARENNAAQPRGMWDAGSQSWIPAQDQTHGKASRKWNPGGVSQWEQAAQQQRDANIRQILANDESAQDRMWGNYASVMDAVRRNKSQSMIDFQHRQGCLMKAAMMNGGAIPDEIVSLFNREGGFDGKTSGLAGGSGFMKDGTFVMRMINGTDQNGNPLVGDIKLDLRKQFVSMIRNRRIFGDDAINTLAGTLQKVGYSPREIENLAYMGGGGSFIDSYRAKGGFGDGSAGGRNIGSVEMSGSVARRLFGVGGDNRSRISFFGTGGAGTGYTMRTYDGHTGEDTGFVNFDQRQAMDAIAANPDHPSHFKVVSSGPRKVSDAYTDENGKRVEARHANGTLYRNDMTGEELWVPEGSSLRAALAGSDPKVLASQYGNDARMARDALNNASREKINSERENGRTARSGARNNLQERALDLKERLGKAGILQKLQDGMLDQGQQKALVGEIMGLLNGASAPAQGGGASASTLDGLTDKARGQKLGGKSQTAQMQPSGPVDVSTLGPQRLVEYRNKYGQIVTTNGYEANGKKYDANGYELVDAPVNTAAQTQRQSVSGLGAETQGANGGSVIGGKTPEKEKSEDEKFDEETESLKKRFLAAGGIVNEDGSFSVSNKEHLKHTRDQVESKYDSIDETLVKRQEFIAKSKKDIADKRKARRTELVKEAKVKFRGNPTAQNKYIEDHLKLWDATKDPSVIENNKIKKELNMVRRLR